MVSYCPNTINVFRIMAVKATVFSFTLGDVSVSNFIFIDSAMIRGKSRFSNRKNVCMYVCRGVNMCDSESDLSWETGCEGFQSFWNFSLEI